MIPPQESTKNSEGIPLRLDRGETDATLAHRMGEGLGVRVSGEVSSPRLRTSTLALCTCRQGQGEESMFAVRHSAALLHSTFCLLHSDGPTPLVRSPKNESPMTNRDPVPVRQSHFVARRWHRSIIEARTPHSHHSPFAFGTPSSSPLDIRHSTLSCPAHRPSPFALLHGCHLQFAIEQSAARQPRRTRPAAGEETETGVARAARWCATSMSIQ